ncbi:urease accessory protein UreD [Pleurocapsales cyanobacterium LEGE 06147]|nr:urease accessory protein UreD [Pleurocapsales cyanobacterium LEGE 06147]
MTRATTIVKPTASGWHGSLDLIYAKRNGATEITHSFAKAPLKVQRSFYPEGKKICHSVILHTAGGIVGGDRLTQKIHLEPDTQSLITTAAATKVYRSNGQQARQAVEINIDRGACLEYLPQETIIFEGAIYRQDLRVELAPEASWLSWEINRFGRSARGEKFYTGDWRSYTEVWQQGKPLWIDRQWLPGKKEVFESIHGLAGKPVVGTFSWIGQSFDKEIVEKARSLWKPRENEGEVGVTTLMSGLLCRYRGNSIGEVKNWFTEIWQLLRLTYLQRSAIKPRVWQI